MKSFSNVQLGFRIKTRIMALTTSISVFIIFTLLNLLAFTRGDSWDKDGEDPGDKCSQLEDAVSLVSKEISSLGRSVRLETNQRESTISKLSTLEHRLTSLQSETQSIRTTLKNMSLVMSEIQEKSDLPHCNKVPSPSPNHPTTCSTYKPTFEYVSNADVSTTEFYNNTPTFTGDTLCKGFVGDIELLGRGHLNNCWSMYSKGEYGFPYGLGVYHLRQPLGIRLQYVPSSQILDGVGSWFDAEKALARANAVNVASIGNLRRGYAGRCNAAGSTKPEVPISYPIRGYLDPDNYNLLKYSYYHKIHPCTNFDILVCAGPV